MKLLSISNKPATDPLRIQRFLIKDVLQFQQSDVIFPGSVFAKLDLSGARSIETRFAARICSAAVSGTNGRNGMATKANENGDPQSPPN